MLLNVYSLRKKNSYHNTKHTDNYVNYSTNSRFVGLWQYNIELWHNVQLQRILSQAYALLGSYLCTIHSHTHAHIHRHEYTLKCTHTCKHTCINTDLYTHTQTYIFKHTFACAHEGICTHAHTLKDHWTFSVWVT